MSDSEFPAGTELFGYRVERLLGRGGMGVVYLCEDLRLHRRVALKLLTGSFAHVESFRTRFLAEAEMAASLDHPHVVPIYEAGDRDGRLFIAMRYVEGSDLRALIRAGPLSARRAVEVCAQLADALDFAHARGLVHADVKPANVLLDPRGHPYLADFGVTRRLEQRVIGLGISGTIDYVAPELIRGEALDGRADEYSLGCMLYECLTGEPPFARSTSAAVLFAHLEEEPPSGPAGLDDVMRTVLAKTPQERYATCAEFAIAAADALGIDEHADWGRRALEWDRQGRDRHLLIAGGELEAAERWRERSTDTELAPTPLQRQFINRSRQAVTRRLLRTRAFVSAGLVVAVALAVLAFVQREVAVSNERTARSLQLAASAEATLDKDPELSTLLALRALRVRDTPQAEQALRDALPYLRVLGTMRTTGPLTDVAFSPDGREIVTAGADGVARVWSTVTHEQIAALREPLGPPAADRSLNSAVFSPDGREVLTSSNDGTARIWSAVTHRQLAVLISPSGGPVSSAVFNPDGREIVAAAPAGAYIWSPTNHALLGTLAEPSGASSDAAAFSPDGGEIITAGSDGVARIWSASTLRQVAELVEPPTAGVFGNALVDVQFSPDGKEILTVSTDGSIRIWSNVTHRELTRLGEPSVNKRGITASFSRDGGEVVTASVGASVAQIWSASSGVQLDVLAGHTAAITAAAFSPNGRELVTSSADGTARLWSASPVEQRGVVYTAGEATVVEAFTAGGRDLLTTTADGTARIWDLARDRGLAFLRDPAGANVFDAEPSPDGKEIVTAGTDGVVRLWSVETHRQLASARVSQAPLTTATFLSGGRQVVIGDAIGEVSSWTPAMHNVAPFSSAPPASSAINTVALSPSGKLLLVATGSGAITLFNVATHRAIGVLHADQGIYGAVFSPNGAQILTKSDDGTARLWSVATHQQLAVFAEPTGSDVFSAEFSPDGKLVVTGSADGTARIWSLATHQQLTVFEEPGGGVVNSALFSPDGREIATSSDDGSVRIWSTELAGPVTRLERIAERRVTRQLTPAEKKLYNVP